MGFEAKKSIAFVLPDRVSRPEENLSSQINSKRIFFSPLLFSLFFLSI